MAGKRKLTFFVPGANLTSTVALDEAEMLIKLWGDALAGCAPNRFVVHVLGQPVFHIALRSIVAITSEVTDA